MTPASTLLCTLTASSSAPAVLSCSVTVPEEATEAAADAMRRLSLLLALAVVYLLLGGGDGDDCDDTPSVGPSPDGLTVHGCVCKGQTTIDGWFDDETFDGCGWAEHQGASTDPPFSVCGASH